MSETPDWSEYGFLPAVRSNGLLFCSGQVGLESDGSVPTDPARQYELAFAALDRVLKAEGCSAADVVEITSFHTNYPSNMEAFMKAKFKFQGKTLPAWTAVGVAALGYPDSLVEIKAIAKIPA